MTTGLRTCPLLAPTLAGYFSASANVGLGLGATSVPFSQGTFTCSEYHDKYTCKYPSRATVAVERLYIFRPVSHCLQKIASSTQDIQQAWSTDLSASLLPLLEHACHHVTKERYGPVDHASALLHSQGRCLIACRLLPLIHRLRCYQQLPQIRRCRAERRGQEGQRHLCIYSEEQ